MKNLCSTGFKISGADQKALAEFLLETPKEWAEKALKGMINKAVKTILREWIERYKVQAGDSISAKIEELIPAIIQMAEFIPYNREATEKNQASREEVADIEVWTGGFDIEDYEEIALNAFYADPEQVLRDYMENKIAKRKEAFVKQYQTVLMNEPETTTIPTKADDMINLITARPEYENRAEREVDLG